MDEIPFRVIVVDKQAQLFDDSVLALSSQNSQGNFDILAEHASFVTHITGPIKLLLKDKKTKVFEAKSGFIHVHNQEAAVYINA